MRRICYITLFMMIAFLTFSKKADAMRSYTSSKTIKWDITGDKKKDKIKFVPNYNQYGDLKSLVIYVNGVKRAKLKITSFCDAYSFKTISLSKKNKFLYIQISSGGRGPVYLLQYKNKKLKNRINLNKSIANESINEYTPKLRKAKGKTVYFECGYHESAPLFAVSYQVKFRYSKGKFRSTSKTYKILGYGPEMDSPSRLTLRKNLKIYKDKKCKKYSKTLKKGKKIRGRITKLYNGKKYETFYIKGTGWFKSNEYVFKELW